MNLSAVVEESKPVDKTIQSSILVFAESCNFDKTHSLQVAKLAVKLFDEFKSLHLLSEEERGWLYCGALLHDIGWIGGREGHHKRSRDMILQASQLPFGPERTIIALLARYHRKSWPEDGHKYYSDLDPVSKRKVKILAGILRIADGLDRSHASLVQDLQAEVNFAGIKIVIETTNPSAQDRKWGKKKADLFEAVFGKEVTIETM